MYLNEVFGYCYFGVALKEMMQFFSRSNNVLTIYCKNANAVFVFIFVFQFSDHFCPSILSERDAMFMVEILSPWWFVARGQMLSWMKDKVVMSQLKTQSCSPLSMCFSGSVYCLLHCMQHACNKLSHTGSTQIFGVQLMAPPGSSWLITQWV